MKILKRTFAIAAIAAALAAIPVQTAGAFWGPHPGIGPWRHSYVYDPGYRFGAPEAKRYIRDLYLYGPTYARWNQQRRYGHWW